MKPPGTMPNTDPAATADYIGTIARELRALAAKSNLGFLSYLLAMVEDDAQATAKRLGAGREAADG